MKLTLLSFLLVGWITFGLPKALGADKDPLSQSLRIDHIGVDNGLTQGSVYHMLNDSRGFLWLGTQDGLNRYDGARFRHYRANASDSTALVGINVSGIVEDRNGNLWVGTEYGLNYYDRATDRFTCLYSYSKSKRLLKSKTIPFYANGQEVLYYSETEGLVSLTIKTRRKLVLDPNIRPTHEYDQLNSTVRTPLGDVWLHAPNGLIRYNLYERKAHYYFSSHPANEAGPSMGVFSFHCDTAGVVWLGTAAGLYRFEPQTGRYQHFIPGNAQALTSIYTIAEDQNGRLWLGTQRGGIWLFDKSTNRFSQVGGFTNSARKLSDYEICKIYIDRQGIIWANTDPDGLVRIVPGSTFFGGMAVSQNEPHEARDPTTLSHFVVRGFLETSPTEMWIATERSLDVLDRPQNRIIRRYLTQARHSDLPSRTLIKCLYKDPLGRIWVGTNGGVFTFDKATSTFAKIALPGSPNSKVVENFVRRLLALDDNTMLAATEDGLFLLDIRQKKFTLLPTLSHQNIFSLGHDRAGRYWVGTYSGGFYCYERPPIGKDPKPQRIVRGLNGYTVLYFYEDPVQPIVWMATDRGLAELNTKTGRIRIYDHRQGLANPFVYGILPDHQNRLWVSTNRGIAFFNTLTKRFKNFDLSDGLQGYEFNGNAYFRTQDGELFFGGVNGFNRFYPEQFRTSAYMPAVHIHTLSVNETPYASTGYIGEIARIELPYDQNTVALEFAALDYYSNGRNQYQYQLVGYDEEWVQSGNATYVRYANLPPGTYTFRVKAANKDGQWSPKIRRLTVVIQPPFWQRSWFMVLIGLLVGAIGFYWLRRRENRIHRQHQVNTRLAVELQEQIKKNLARDLHDEIGTQLATLKLYVSRLSDPPDQAVRGNSLSELARQLISDIIGNIRNLLRELSPRTLEQYGYSAAVEELLSRIDKSTLETHFWADELPARLEAETELMLYRITQELLNNTLKHANARQVSIRLVYEEPQLKLYYNDDGQGFDYKAARRGLGIGNIESRVALINGEIDWQSAPGDGTRAVVTLTYRPSNRFLSRHRLERSFRKVTALF
ncbi:two-component regulator propeller domain-containing protein [Larkinella bovis]|uniref:Two-component regulator propeller domain-containing protein n=1 Tax=Larkinella bovis TaxID=683041 RepID=A0ABW0ICA1_9BACT